MAEATSSEAVNYWKPGFRPTLYWTGTALVFIGVIAIVVGTVLFQDVDDLNAAQKAALYHTRPRQFFSILVMVGSTYVTGGLALVVGVGLHVWRRFRPA